LDLNEPWKIIKISERPIFEPEADYEVKGFTPNVVFTNGIIEKNGKLYIYYGSADETACLATTTVDELLCSF
jgi:predicted GH43/DUF377 family glycosyl hydrolase